MVKVQLLTLDTQTLYNIYYVVYTQYIYLPIALHNVKKK